MLCSYRAVNEQLNNIGIIVSRKWMHTLCRSEMDVLFQMSLATGTYITCGISSTSVSYVSLCKFVKKKKKKKKHKPTTIICYTDLIDRAEDILVCHSNTLKRSGSLPSQWIPPLRSMQEKRLEITEEDIMYLCFSCRNFVTELWIVMMGEGRLLHCTHCAPKSNHVDP